MADPTFDFATADTSGNRCYLCTREISVSGEDSIEDYIPKWAKRKFDLSDARLQLQNGTTIPYRQLAAACCGTCNRSLGKIESSLAAGVRRGDPELSDLTRADLWRWLAKLLYGILFQEARLPRDRKDPDGPRIIAPEDLDRARVLRALAICEGFPNQGRPGSVLTFAMDPEEPIGRAAGWFDLKTAPGLSCVAVRLGTVGTIGLLLDACAIERYAGPTLQEYRKQRYSAAQFRELAAKLFYLTALLETRYQEVPSGEPGTLKFAQVWRPGARSIFRRWDMRGFSRILASYLGAEEGAFFLPPDRVKTTFGGWEEGLEVRLCDIPEFARAMSARTGHAPWQERGRGTTDA